MASDLLTYGIGAVFVYWAVQRYRYLNDLKTIPTIGPSGFFSSFKGAFKYVQHAREIIEEGYQQYPETAFKIYTLEGWIIMAPGIDRLRDLTKAPDDVLSFIAAANDSLQSEHTMGPEMLHDQYHVATVRTTLTRNIAARFEDVREELTAAFSDHIPVGTGEWKSVRVLDTIMKIVVRASNRLFVGLPLCRNEDYLKINVGYTIDVIKSAQILKLFPEPLRPLVAIVQTRTNSTFKRAGKHLEPILRYRLEQDEKYGKDWDGRPNDFISWLLDIAVGQQRTLRDLTLRVLAINFAAIHTTSMSFTHAIFDLASHPEYIKPLREEVDTVTSEHGWTKASMQKLRKLDSFLKESQRMWGLGSISSTRKVLKDFAFANGQIVTKGYFIAAPSSSIHHDEVNYTDAHEFKPLRFSDMREEEGEAVFHQLITPSNDFWAFGVGRHACPGRFFAANELKLGLAHLVANYDVKLANGDSARPPNFNFQHSLSPNRNGEVLIRKRKD